MDHRSSLRAATKAGLAARMICVVETPILPAEQKGPLRLPAWLHKTAGEEFISLKTAT